MKKFSKKLTALFLSLLSVISIFLVPVSAAVSWPSIGKNRPIKAYTLSTGNNTTSYSTKNLTNKRGTVYASDELNIYAIGKNSKGTYYIYASYPISNGQKYAYLPLSVVTKASPVEPVNPVKV